MFARSSINFIVGNLPNKFSMTFDFGAEVHEATFTGQSSKEEAYQRPYAGFFSYDLVAALAGPYSKVKINIEDKPIGTLNLRDSSWAIKKGLSKCY